MQVRAFSMAVVRRRPWWQGVAVWLAAAGFVLAAPLARAQMYFDVAGGPITAVPNMVGPAIVGASMGSYIDRAERGKERSAGRTAAPPGKGGAAAPALRIGSDAAVSRQAKQQFRAQLLRNNPGQAARIDQALARDWLAGYRREVARPNGLDVANLADAMTAYVLSSWVLVQGTRIDSPQSIRAVRDRMRVRLAQQPQLARMGAAGRQRLGEALIYHTVLNLANSDHFARGALQALGSPDAATRQRAIAQVQEAPQRYAPPVLYALSHVLMQQGRNDQAMFWFYAGQLRGRYDANRCADVSARQAIAVLNQRYGGPINQYAFRHLPQLEKTVQEVLAWDRRTPHDYDHRWINLHGMGAFGASGGGEGPAALSLPEAQWPAIAEQTRVDYLKGFQEAMARIGRRPDQR